MLDFYNQAKREISFTIDRTQTLLPVYYTVSFSNGFNYIGIRKKLTDDILIYRFNNLDELCSRNLIKENYIKLNKN